MRFLLFFAIFSGIFSNFQSVYASPSEIYARGTGVHREVITLTLHVEEGVWRLLEIHRDGQNLPEIVKRMIFPDFSAGRKTFDELARNQSLSIIEDPIQLTQPNRKRSVGVLSELPTDEIWHATESWNWDWERRYTEWFRETVHSRFLMDHGIPSDCADLAYIVRWVFARIHKLPAANHLAGSDELLFTNSSMRAAWSSLPTNEDWARDQRFLAALAYLTDLTYTHTLDRDSYPVEINSESIRAGGHHLALHEDTGHTMVIRETSQSTDQIPISFFWSNVPKIVRELYTSYFFDSDSEWPSRAEGGFLRMRWPVVGSRGIRLATAGEMPHYSEEQYSRETLGVPESVSFLRAFLERLQPGFDPKLLMRSLAGEIVTLFQNRVAIVEEGFRFCSVNDCSEGTANYENYSTPTRDKRIIEFIDVFNLLPFQFRDEAQTGYDPNPELVELSDSLLRTTRVNLLGQDFSLKSLIEYWPLKAFSSDPRDEIEIRWAFTARGVLKSISRRLSQLLVNREEKIRLQGSACTGVGSCDYGSESWKRWNTHSLDAKISRQSKLPEAYCEILKEGDPGECARLDAESANFPVRGKTVGEWGQTTLWLNSDPRASTEVRWGSTGNGRRVLFLPHQSIQNWSTDQTRAIVHRASRVSGKESTFLSINSVESIHIPEGWKLGDFQSETGIAYAYRTDSNRLLISFFRPGEGPFREQAFPLPEIGKGEIAWSDSGTLAVRNDRILTTFHPVSGSIHTFALPQDFDAQMYDRNVYLNFIFIDDPAHGFSLLDLSGEEPIVTPLPSAISRTLSLSLPEAYVFSSGNQEHPGDSILVEKGSGRNLGALPGHPSVSERKTNDRSDSGSIFLWSRNINDKTRSVSVASWDPSSRQIRMLRTLSDSSCSEEPVHWNGTLQGVNLWFDPQGECSYENPWKSVSFKFTNARDAEPRIEELALRLGETSVRWTNTGYLLFQLSEGGSGLREEGGRVVSWIPNFRNYGMAHLKVGQIPESLLYFSDWWADAEGNNEYEVNNIFSLDPARERREIPFLTGAPNFLVHPLQYDSVPSTLFTDESDGLKFRLYLPKVERHPGTAGSFNNRNIFLIL